MGDLMASSLEQLQEMTGADVGELLRARARTAERIAHRRELLAALDVDGDATVVLMGSWGRRELTPRSDDDYMVLVRGPRGSAPPRPLPEAVGRAFAADPGGSAGPGREGSSRRSSTRPTWSRESGSTTTRTRT